MNIRKLDADDLGYALFSWRQSAKEAPGLRGVPWGYYKDAVVPVFAKILEAPTTAVLGAYVDDTLVGWLAGTPGKRVHTVHWVYVKHEVDGRHPRRHGVMTALLDAADLGARFVYTLRGRRLDRDERKQFGAASLDEVLVTSLRARGVTATYMAMKEWLK